VTGGLFAEISHNYSAIFLRVKPFKIKNIIEHFPFHGKIDSEKLENRK